MFLATTQSSRHAPSCRPRLLMEKQPVLMATAHGVGLLLKKSQPLSVLAESLIAAGRSTDLELARQQNGAFLFSSLPFFSFLRVPKSESFMRRPSTALGCHKRLHCFVLPTSFDFELRHFAVQRGWFDIQFSGSAVFAVNFSMAPR